jgi:hypothetical protein
MNSDYNTPVSTYSSNAQRERKVPLEVEKEVKLVLINP